MAKKQKTSGTSSKEDILKSLYGDETVWKMGDVYRQLIDSENRLASNRRNWYLAINTFLGGVLGLLWSNNCPCYFNPSMVLSTILLTALS